MHRPSPRLLVEVLSFVLLLLVTGSCVLIVDPSAGGAHCVLTPAGSDCATCLASRCTAEVDRCCMEGSCGGIVPLFEQCTRTHDESCGRLRTRTASPDANEARAATCAVENCGGVCGERAGRPLTECSTSHSGESTCECLFGGRATTELECSESAFPATHCCSSPGWPAAGLTCACIPFVCNPSGTGCFCSLNEFASPGYQPTCGKKGMICCAYGGTCKCGLSDKCGPSEHQVETCTIDTVDCPTDQERTPSCSVRER